MNGNGIVDLAQREAHMRAAIGQVTTETEIAIYAAMIGNMQTINPEQCRAAAATAVKAAPFLLEAKGLMQIETRQPGEKAEGT